MGTIVALAGGVGAARFLRGLVRAVPAEDVVIVGNTGDDEVFHGLHVSPDLDTVTYTLAGAVGSAGWGLAGDTFRTLEAYERYGEATWFRLGDADLATHLYRTSRLREGATLSEVTAEITLAWGVKAKLLPMSDDRVATVIDVVPPGGGKDGEDGHAGVVRAGAGPAAGARRPLRGRGRCPAGAGGARGAAGGRGDPALPVQPRDLDRADPGPARRARHPPGPAGTGGGREPDHPGATGQGPADRLMAAVGLEVSCAGVASIYADICATLLVDESDTDQVADVERHGVRAAVAPILMRDADGAERLARRALDLLA